MHVIMLLRGRIRGYAKCRGQIRPGCEFILRISALLFGIGLRNLLGMVLLICYEWCYLL